MGRYFSFENGVESIRVLPSVLISDGERVAPRGLRTYELRDVLIEVQNPRDVTMLGIGRKWNPRIAVAEFLQLVGGFSEPETMQKIAPFFSTVLNGGVFHGAYGPRISMQMPKVLERLHRDSLTRQAVSVIWDPLHDIMQEERLDLPCTVDMVFAIRSAKLHMSIHMRSNDVWKGWCYDLFQFAQMQCTVANILGVDVGSYTHFANSFHLYESDAAAASNISTRGKQPQPRLDGLHVPSWAAAQRVALQLWNDGMTEDATFTENWMGGIVETFWEDKV